MLFRIWLLPAVSAMIFTLLWLFGERRLYVTTGLAAGLWSLTFILADNVEVINESTGAREAVELASLQYAMLAFALLSFIALVGYYFGFYPPKEHRIGSPEESELYDS